MFLRIRTIISYCAIIYYVFLSNVICSIPLHPNYTPLCQNESKIFIVWKKPASGWYHYDYSRESYIRRPPGSDWNSYRSFYEFFHSTDGHWKLQEFSDNSFFNIKTLHYNGPNPFFINENEPVMVKGVHIKDIYRDLQQTNLDYYDDDEDKPINKNQNGISRRPFKVTCPHRCSCEIVNVDIVGQQSIQFYSLDIARLWVDNCSSVLSLYNLTEVSSNSSEFTMDEDAAIGSWWRPEAYVSKSCQILYYNAEYDTWHADMMPSRSCAFKEFFSSDSSQCIEGLPFPSFQKWDTYVEIGDLNSDVVQHLCSKAYDIKESSSFSVTCACRCKVVSVVLIDGRQAINVTFSRSDLFEHLPNKSNSCQSEIDIFYQRNNIPISHKVASERSLNWKLDYYLSKDCQILYQNIYDNSWIIDLYSNKKCKFTRFVCHNKSKCIENLPPVQQWSSNHYLFNIEGNECQYQTSNMDVFSMSCMQLEF